MSGVGLDRKMRNGKMMDGSVRTWWLYETEKRYVASHLTEKLVATKPRRFRSLLNVSLIPGYRRRSWLEPSLGQTVAGSSPLSTNRYVDTSGFSVIFFVIVICPWSSAIMLDREREKPLR